MEKQDLAAY